MRIDTALEAIARIGMDAGCAACAGRAQRVEPGAFKEHVHGLVRDCRGLSAHHTPQADDAAVIGDDAHLFADLVGLAVQRLQHLALAAKAGHDGPRQFGGIVSMQRTSPVKRDVIRHIHQQGFRLDADGLQALLHPLRRRTIRHADNYGSGEHRTSLGRVQPDLDGAFLGANDLLDVRVQEAPCPGRGQVTGDALHAQPVRPIWRYFEVDHRVIQTERIGNWRPKRNGIIQISDAVMVLTRFNLLGGAHHAMALDAADLARFLVEREVEPRNERAERRIDRGHASPRIWRTTDNLLLAIDRIDRTDAQLVRIRMRLSRLDLADRKRRQLLARVHNLLHLEASLQHEGQNIVQRRLGGEVVVQPGQGEFHCLFHFRNRFGA